jgi:hypothetical protein
MRIGRFLLPWIGAMLLSATIVHAAESVLASSGQPAVVTGCQAAPAELAFAQLPRPRTTSDDIAYVHFK